MTRCYLFVSAQLETFDKALLEGISSVSREDPLVTHLKRAVMLDGPDAHGDAHDGNEDEWDEYEYPEMTSSLQLVTDQQLEHEEDQVQRQADEHGLVVHIRLTL